MTCRACTTFFTKYQCSRYRGACDCPKCQGLCTCHYAVMGPSNQAGMTDKEYWEMMDTRDDEEY